MTSQPRLLKRKRDPLPQGIVTLRMRLPVDQAAFVEAHSKGGLDAFIEDAVLQKLEREQQPRASPVR